MYLLAVMLFTWVELLKLYSLVSTLNSVKGQKLKVGLSCYSGAKTWKLKAQKQKRNKHKGEKNPLSVWS